MSGLNKALEDAFARYVKGARPALRRHAFVLMGDWHAADDLVQQTLITIYRRWDRLDRHDNLGPYTRTVMVRHFLSDRRKHRWTRELLRSALPEPDPTPEEAARVGDRLVLLAALATLSPGSAALSTCATGMT